MPVARLAVLLLAAIAAAAGAGALPPVPEPAENPTTEAKRVLGKILFWDEQLSSDNSVACGTCHRPASGGADPRAGVHPGKDKGTIDDVLGSPGIAALDASGKPVVHPVFGTSPQVTPRAAPSNFGALWADELFWDGSAGGTLRDPLTGEVVIARGGALENQALTALANEAEMAHAGRTWAELTAKVASSRPLALATDLPADVAAALAARPSYPALFEAAFGDPAVTPVRIAFAIAAYQRTLVADQTPWDRYVAGDERALTPSQVYGWEAFRAFHCDKCHVPPLFTNNDFFNIAVRRAELDRGRERVTGDPEDAGEMKVPSLRNVGLRPRFMHTGGFGNLGAAVSFYVSATALPERDGIPGAGIYTFNLSNIQVADIRDFLSGGLTDPRVRDERFPFDRPKLRTERHTDDRTPPSSPGRFTASRTADGVRLAWDAAHDDTGVVDYVLARDGRVIAYPTGTSYVDEARGGGARYVLVARDAARNVSAPAEAALGPP
ncbi:MAG TPA: cytochrome c peroxidase [Gammaproteobacteria bacterium]